MHEYLRILNDSGSVIIDDTYRNFHFIKKVVRQRLVTDAIPMGNPFFNNRDSSVKCHRFTVVSVEQPIIAFDNVPVLHIFHEELSPNTWEISVFFTVDYNVINTFPMESVNYYVYGLLPAVDTNQRPALIVRNAANEIVFSSSHGPMVIVDVLSRSLEGLNANGWNWVEHVIPNYNPNRKYVVALCGGCSFTISNPDDATNYIYQSYCLRKTVSKTKPELSDRFLVGLAPTTHGYTSNYYYHDPIHTHMILDVTGL